MSKWILAVALLGCLALAAAEVRNQHAPQWRFHSVMAGVDAARQQATVGFLIPAAPAARLPPLCPRLRTGHVGREDSGEQRAAWELSRQGATGQ